MYCSNCGAKLPVKGKFCPECGENTSSAQKNPLKSKNPAEPLEVTLVRPKPKPNGCCTAILVLFIIFSFIPMIVYISGGDTANLFGWMSGLLIIGSIALIIWLGISIMKWLVKLGLKKPIALLIVVGVAVLLFIPAYLSYQSYIYNELSQRVFFLEDKVTEISAAKMLGDTIMKPGNLAVSGVTLQNVNDAASAEKVRVNEVLYTSELTDYKNVTSVWADKIAVAKDVSSWNALSDSPEKFELIASNSSLEKILKQTVDDIAAIKDAGDWAIKKQDRSAMRFVAARLVAIDHLLTSIESYQSVANSGFIKSAYAATKSGAVIRHRTICFSSGGGKTTCINSVRDSVGSAKFIAQKGYTVGLADPERTTADWNQSFDGINLPPPATPLGGAGISQGEPNVGPQLSPREIAFRNYCRSKGGNPDPTSITKTRLPTTESGYDCQIGGCWEFMTYTGRSYAGGNNGCPEQGLVPQAPPMEKAVDSIDNTINDINSNLNNNGGSNNDGGGTTPTVASYDGSYYITTNVSCSVSGIGAVPIPLQSESITVSNNRFTDRNGKTISISSSGQAQSTFSANVTGASMGMIEKYQFYSNGSVRGTMSLSGGGSDTVNIPGMGNYSGSTSIGCSGTISGSRR